MIGQVLASRYRVAREIGRGGMGVVYLARDLVLERDVALKVIPPAMLYPEAEERLRREARVAARMDHPGIVTIFDIVAHEDSIFLVMPFVNGVTLRALMQEGTLSTDDIVEIVIQSAEALDYSHTQSVTHRDIKPENILIEVDAPGGMRVRITDFGVAAAAFEQRVTQTGAIIGTAGYLSPEQVTEDAVDGRTDLYALGTVFYECFAGRTPFTGKAPAIFYRILFDAPKPIRSFRSDFDEALDAIVLRCLAKDPQQRFARGKDLAELLQTYRRRQVSSATESVSATELFAPTSSGPSIPKLVGRANEMGALIHMLDQATAGQCFFAVLGGQAGVGKTRLLDELERLSKSRGLRVLHGRFLEQDHVFPYQAFCDAFQEFFKSEGTSQDSRQINFSDLSTDLMSLFPSLGEVDRIKSGASDSGKHSLFTASMRFDDQTTVFEVIARTVTRIADSRPLVLLLEDLHAADVSVLALEYVVRRLSSTPTMIVATYRTEKLSKTHPLSRLLDGFRGDRRFAHFRLDPLEADDFKAFVFARIGSRNVDARLVDRLFDFSEGNPFFASELLVTLQGLGAIAESDEGQWELAETGVILKDALPDSVQALVEERIERLGPDERSLLSIASVIGQIFDIRDLETLAPDPDGVEDLIDALIDAGILAEERGSRGDRVVFSSSLVREVLYARLPRRKRRQLHAAFADYLERRSGGKQLHQLVHHYASADDPDKVVHYGLKLARAALDAFSPDDAAKAARTVLEFLGEDQESTAAIEGPARLLLASALRLGGQLDGALREVEAAIAKLERDPTADRANAYYLAAEISWQARRIEKARKWIELAIPATRETGDDRRLKRLLMLGATVANLRGERATATTRLHELEALRAATEKKAVDDTAREAVRRGALRIPVPSNLHVATLDPVVIVGEVGAEICCTIFDTLMRQTSGARIVPWLVDSVRCEEDGRAWRFLLKSGITFHDGRPLRAEDVKYSFERLLKSPSAEFRWYFAPIVGADALMNGAAADLAGFQILNQNEFVVMLERPVACFSALLTDISTAIVPEGSATETGSKSSHMVGSGPFRIVSFVPNQRLELEANPNYWRAALPRSETLVFSFGVSPVEAMAGFQSGEYSIAWGLLASDAEALRRDPELEAGFRETPRLSTEFLAFNTHSGPFADEGLRRHIAQVINPEKIARKGGHVHAVPARGLFPPGLISREGRRRATTGGLDTASVAGPIQATLATAPLFRHEAYKGVMSEIVAALGMGAIDARVVAPGPDALTAARTGATVDLLVDGWMADYPDPDAMAFGLLHSEHGWVGRMCGNDELDRLIVRGRAEAVAATRQEIYWEIEHYVARHAILLPLFHGRVVRFARPEVDGFELYFHVPHVAYEELAIKP